LRVVLNIVGLILAFFAIVWIHQGPGHIKWAVIGGVTLLIAIFVLFSANRRKA
jgi:hypothetical protein